VHMCIKFEVDTTCNCGDIEANVKMLTDIINTSELFMQFSLKYLGLNIFNIMQFVMATDMLY